KRPASRGAFSLKRPEGFEPPTITSRFVPSREAASSLKRSFSHPSGHESCVFVGPASRGAFSLKRPEGFEAPTDQQLVRTERLRRELAEAKLQPSFRARLRRRLTAHPRRFARSHVLDVVQRRLRDAPSQITAAEQ
ncbi:MAG TPA: hypothetical protein VLA37_11665, partial [Sphingomonadaceae bacterium]|nr:hypothetical protein [Sphingomonadaceae bacterium]